MRLLVLDVEGTLFETDIRLQGSALDSTIWQGIAHALGPNAELEEVESHERWQAGGYKSYLEWVKDSVNIHRRYGLSSSLFNQLILSAKYNPGVPETLARVNRSEFEIVLISGGFRELAARAQRDLKILHAFSACEYLFDEDGTLESYNLLPCDFEGKIDFIRLMLREYGLQPDDWWFVGDGANDIAIAKAAPLSIGYRPHPDLEKVVTHTIMHFEELGNILGLGKSLDKEGKTHGNVRWRR